MDLLGISLTDLSAISERRLARLVDPTMSYGLPRNLLAGQRGLNTGFATVQCTHVGPGHGEPPSGDAGAVSTVSRARATPKITSPIPPGARRKARTIVENAEQVVAAEALMAAQALSLVEPFGPRLSARQGHAGGAGSHPRGDSARPWTATAGITTRSRRPWRWPGPARSSRRWRRPSAPWSKG